MAPRGRIRAATFARLLSAAYVAAVFAASDAAWRAVAPPDAPVGGAALVAMTAVAVSFTAVRRGADRLALRLVGGTADGRRVLSQLAGHLAAMEEPEDALAAAARTVASAVEASRVVIWVNVDGEPNAVAGWPSAAGAPAGPPVDAVPVHHAGVVLGWIGVELRGNCDLAPAELELLSSVAAHAAPALANVLATRELASQLERLQRHAAELREARRRVVELGDAERRRLERDLHDGAQQIVMAVILRIGLAESLVDRAPARAGPVVAELAALAAEAREAIRDAGAGLDPRLLREHGLAGALRAHASRCAVPVELRIGVLPELDEAAAAAVYFGCVEALQNATKHAGASRVWVDVWSDDGVSFRVTDDGVGFDAGAAPGGSGLRNLGERFSALDGWFDVETRPGGGTSISGRVPNRRRAEAPA